MEYFTEVYDSFDEQLWNSKLLENNSSTTYQSLNWSLTYKIGYHSKPIFFTVRDSNNNIVGQLLSFIHSKYYWANSHPAIQNLASKLDLGSILMWWYGPIIHDEYHKVEILTKIFEEVEKFAKQNKIMMIRGSFPALSKFQNESILTKFGFSIIPWSTYIVNLQQSKDAIYSKLNKKIRYDIRKAEQQQLEFNIGNNRESLSEYEQMKFISLKSLGKKSGKKNKTFYDSQWEHLQKKGYQKLFRVKNDDETLGAILGVIFNNNVVQHGVVNSLKSTSSAGSFLTWNTIKWCMDSGYSTFDMGGANPNPSSQKEEQIDFYKSKWQGDKIQYLTFFKVLDRVKFGLSKFMMNPKRAIQMINLIR